MRSIPRILIFLTVFIAFAHSSLAQRQQDKEQANLYMEQAELILSETKAMDDARDLMVAAANYDTTNVKANYEAGSMYLLTTGKERATRFFLRAYRQDPNYKFDFEYWIGKSYQYALNFDKAIEFFDRYKKKLAGNPNYKGADKFSMEEVDRRIVECQNGKEFVENPTNFSIVNLGSEINSEFDDYAPVINADEDELVFTSRRRDGNMNENVAEDNKPYEDIFFATKVDGKWTHAKNIGDQVNTLYNESNLALSPDGKTLFIYRDENGGDVYFSTRQEDDTWTVPEALPGDVNSDYRETSVSVTNDGKTLYFASDRPGGLGGSDIYVSTKNGMNEWTKVKNLGPTINSELDEDSPFIDYEGTTLYFSSEGKKGMGGFDIFKSKLQNAKKNQWGEVQNLGYPINTPDNDIFYVGTKNNEKGYYSSIRDDGMGYSDIYVVTTEPEKEQPVELPKKVLGTLLYEVTVVDADTKAPMEAKVKLRGTSDNVVVGSRMMKEGIYAFSIKEAEVKSYTLSVEKEGYIFENQVMDIEGATDENKTISQTIALRKLVVGASAVLRNIYFDYGKATFRDASYSELNKLENMLKENDGVEVEISGHTDNVSSASFNKKLSLRRANAVKDFLVSKGIDTRRITAVGYGEERPLASNDDEKDGRELNRRVEFKVLGN